jgi:hypothetical protein
MIKVFKVGDKFEPYEGETLTLVEEDSSVMAYTENGPDKIWKTKYSNGSVVLVSESSLSCYKRLN